MEKSIGIMLDRITGILSDNNPSIYLFGSVVLDDFKLGWSDIDLVCLTEKTIAKRQAEDLVGLRQSLLLSFPGNPYFRSFEGGFLTWEAFLKRTKDTVVYWGTSGQRITDTYCFDPFSTMELLTRGRWLYGPDNRERIAYPAREEIVHAVEAHYNTIRRFAKETSKSLYLAGWLLDIARCLYTLENNDIIAKTKAGKWAVENNLAPDLAILQQAIWIRENPVKAKADEKTLAFLASLGPHIQQFAGVLETRLRAAKAQIMTNTAKNI